MTLQPRHTHFWPGKDEADAGWRTYVYPMTDVAETHTNRFLDMGVWIYKNVEDCQENARWFQDKHCIFVKFNRSTDAIMFSLVWGPGESL